MKCQRCGQFASEVNMAGGYKANLCLDCRNEFAVVLYHSVSYKPWRMMQATLDCKAGLLAGGNPGFKPLKVEDIVKEYGELVDLTWDIWEIAAKFAAERIDRRSDIVTEDEASVVPGPVEKQPIGADHIEELLADGTRRKPSEPELTDATEADD